MTTQTHAEPASNALRRLYQLYKPCVACVVVKDQHGDLHRGAAFHIGNGFLVTARHVVQSMEIAEVVPHNYARTPVTVKRIHTPPGEHIDLAILETDFSLEHYMTKVQILEGDLPREKVDFVPIGGHLDDWLDDGLILSKAILIGYPIIPRVPSLEAVVVETEVNAIVSRYDEPYAHFIISAVPRGGFSGSPVLSEFGFLLGVMTDSLYGNDQPHELGFASAVSVEPLLELIHEEKIDCGENLAFARELFGSAENGSSDDKH
jgi:V8-like Glu-specific endopeptidase